MKFSSNWRHQVISVFTAPKGRLFRAQSLKKHRFLVADLLIFVLISAVNYANKLISDVAGN